MIKVVLDMNTNMGMRLRNPVKQAAIVHPKARFLVYELRVEVQTEDDRNAKIYPRGISLTTNNMALVYLLDEAGARSTSTPPTLSTRCLRDLGLRRSLGKPSRRESGLWMRTSTRGPRQGSTC